MLDSCCWCTIPSSLKISKDDRDSDDEINKLNCLLQEIKYAGKTISTDELDYYERKLKRYINKNKMED